MELPVCTTRLLFQPILPVIVKGVLYLSSSVGSKLYAFAPSNPELGRADLFLRIIPTPTSVQPGDLLTYAFPVWNLGSDNAVYEVLSTQVPEGTTFDYVRISGTPGLGTCTTPPYPGKRGPPSSATKTASWRQIAHGRCA